MSLLNKQKLKQLYQELPQNVVVSASWLKKHDISMQLRHKYLHSECLYNKSRKLYMGRIISWYPTICKTTISHRRVKSTIASRIRTLFINR